ncbi:MAG TPA: hypothetical protein VF211_12920 [Burkholderiales bacterium]
MSRLAAAVLLALAGRLAAAPPAGSADAPELAACLQWLRALDAEVAAAGARDLEYSRVPGFPYLRVDTFLAQARERASRSDAAFAAFADRLLEHDLESRRYEIDNLPAAVVEKFSGMRFDDSRAIALRRTRQCGRLLREAQLADPRKRAALIARAAVEPAPPAPACPAPGAASAGARVRYAPPPAAASREDAARWLLRGASDPLGQARLSEAELGALAAAYAPSLEVTVASDADRFGALRWGRAAAPPRIDATEPAVYVARRYGYYEGRALLQLEYTLRFPGHRIAWRVTLAPDGEPLVYDALGADGCRTVVLTPRARLRGAAAAPTQTLPSARAGERPLLALAAGTHALRALGLVRGSDSLARYALRPYRELRSSPTFDRRNRAAAGRPPFAGQAPLDERLVLDLAEARP